MSQFIETLLRQGGAGIDLNAWNQLIANLPRRGRRIEVRLASANRTLASLRLGERSERRMLQIAREELEISRKDGVYARKSSIAVAELALEVETHQANLKAIEQQIALVRLAIEHLHRRCVGWSSKQADRSAPNVNEDVDRANEHMQRGFAAVHAIRALRTSNHSTGVNY